MQNAPPIAVKRRFVYQALRRRIDSGEVRPGERLPSETSLVKEFGVSRPTVSRALADLVRDGRIIRKRGSGSYVAFDEPHTRPYAFLTSADDLAGPLRNALEACVTVIQQAGGEILSEEAQDPHEPALMADVARSLLDACRRLIERRVAGVFFVPLSAGPASTVARDSNLKAINMLRQAKTPFVLVGRDCVPYPSRSPHDLIGIDDRLATMAVTQHLLDKGATNAHFLATTPPLQIDARAAGFLDAIAMRERKWTAADRLHTFDPTDSARVREWLVKHRPDGVVCADDLAAGRLLHSLHELGVEVPRDMLVAGVDGSNYSELFRVKLTTVQRPLQALGRAAYRALVARIAHPDEPPSTILLQAEPIFRDSTAPQQHSATDDAPSSEERLRGARASSRRSRPPEGVKWKHL